MSNHLQQAIESLRGEPEDEEVTKLKARIKALEARIVGLEFDLFRALYGEEEGLRDISIKTIAEMVESRTGQTLNDLRSGRRDRKLSYARHVFWYLARKHTKKSLPLLGSFLDKDHTSVIHGIRMTKKRIDDYPGIRELVDGISADIRSIQKAS